ncbi:hypothetical protein Pan216_25820 [Planctomycetes bacterium Pan216]|uniref:Sulfatase n=1 Tax=Kolteria novifilia TaxID=2527975 RepID=A0A518B402_9BACT|nr:hypothetical protein Pan216_25820 [Planctomycetes bacterium Pan216]
MSWNTTSHGSEPSGHSRRDFLAALGLGAGSIGLSTMLADEQALASSSKPGGVAAPHFPPKAERVIFLFMAGGPSQVDSFDPKPALATLQGQSVPDSIAREIPKIKRAGLHNIMRSPFKFKKRGESGLDVSELFPETAKHADDLCVIRSMHHRNPVHGPAECVALTGTQLGDRPSLGAWMLYGLGSPNRNLPGYMVMNINSVGMQFPQAAGWGTGFMPARYQGTVIDPRRGIDDIATPASYTPSARRRQLDLVRWLNGRHLESLGEHSELEARIRSYEMAFRMQSAAPELFDLSSVPSPVKAAYGTEDKPTSAMGRACLLARRMVERGVRIVQIRVGGWDAHGALERNHRSMAAKTDRPVAALLADLKARGLLDSTLVVWGGEFGRTPTMEGRGKGRDHNPSGYTVWLAGGGVKGGHVIGTTDPLGYVAVERPVRPSDLHATILHALGIDQHKLIYQHNGRDELATVLGGDVVHEVFA